MPEEGPQDRKLCVRSKKIPLYNITTQSLAERLVVQDSDYHKLQYFSASVYALQHSYNAIPKAEVYTH